jgi:hypothetical protein
MMDLLQNKQLPLIPKFGLNLLLFSTTLLEKMDAWLPYVKDIILIKLLPHKDILDNMLKKYLKILNLRTLGLELNKNISYLLDKELPTDGP